MYRVVVSTIQVETCFRLGSRCQGCPYVVKAPGFRNGRSRSNGGLPWDVRYGECISGLPLTFAVMLITSLAYLFTSAQRDCVGGIFTSTNRRGCSKRDTIASSSVMATRRSTTPSGN